MLGETMKYEYALIHLSRRKKQKTDSVFLKINKNCEMHLRMWFKPAIIKY